MTPYLQDQDFTLYNCDVLEGLAQLEDESVHCVGIELNPDYCELIAKRTAQLSLLGEEAVRPGVRVLAGGGMVLVGPDRMVMARGCRRTVGSSWFPRSCAHVLPCPLHDRERGPRMSDQELADFVRSWKPWAARCSTAAAGALPLPQCGAPASVPLPRLFEEDD